MKSIAERFWSKVDIRGPDECWPWMAAVSANGYGNFWSGERYEGAHCVAFRISGKTLPNNQLVLHSCDFRPCCNPRHLFAGTYADNIHDSMKKGRYHVGRRLRGATNPMAKLNEEMVASARRRFDDGERCCALAREYGVSWPVMMRAISGRSWAHL